MANFALLGSKTYQIVFYGGAWVNITTSAGLSEADGYAADEIAPFQTGRFFYRSMAETLTALGVQINESNVCYIRDITSDTTKKPNAIGMVTTALPYDIEFSAFGQYQATTDVDGIQYVQRAGTIAAVFLTRAFAGTSSDSIVDVHKNGTTLWTTQANRPKIAWNDGDKKVIATLPDVVSLAEGDLLTFDIDQIEAGGPKDLRLKLVVVPTI